MKRVIKKHINNIISFSKTNNKWVRVPGFPNLRTLFPYQAGENLQRRVKVYEQY
jgi:hypothetical protein